MNFKYSKELFIVGIISMLLSCNSLGLPAQKTQIEKNEEINNSPITSTSSQYPIVDTNQEKCFDVSGVQISCMQTGQDAQYKTLSPSFLQKTLTFEHRFQKHLNSVYTFI